MVHLGRSGARERFPIVVDGDGMTVYMFDNDTQGGNASSCEGECATNWPAVTTDAVAPAVEGLTGELGTITGVDVDLLALSLLLLALSLLLHCSGGGGLWSR